MNDMENLESWEYQIGIWLKKYDCKTLPAVNEENLLRCEKQLGGIPKDLKSFYCVTNGLFCPSFSILPIEDPNNIKATWESINRANNLSNTVYLNSNQYLLNEFLVFGDIGSLQAVAYRKEDESIWYEEDGNLYETDLSLMEFVEGMLAEDEVL